VPGSTRSASRGRGRPPQITREQVVDAAARLGPTGLTVQAVADQLGVTRAAIYHYVADVEELRRIAAYGRISPFAVLADEDRSWQEWLRDFARAGRRWRLRHGEVHPRLSLDLPGMDWFLVIVDRVIDVLVEAGFSEQRARHAFQFLGGVLWINTQDELNALTAEPPPLLKPRPEGYPDGFPDLPHIRSATEDTTWWSDPDERFEREIDWVIAALESELEQQKG
jgi:AcrR family transcriptional regulator